MEGNVAMPNRTIYVSDDDLPVFEEAQRLAGANLSATIARALRRFVDAERPRAAGFEEITVQVGKAVHIPQRFLGRTLAKGQSGERAEPQREVYEVFQTAKGRFALHRKRVPNWGYRPAGGWDDPDADWSGWTSRQDEYTLAVFDTLEELRPHIPDEIYHAVQGRMSAEPAPALDI